MEKELTAICICSGDEKLDISRADIGINFRKNLEKKVPIRILGGGPDLYTALDYYDSFKNKEISENEYLGKLNNLDQHIKLYNYVLEKTGETPQVVHKTTTLVQNILYGFTKPEEGLFAIVTEPWHYKKFNMIQKVLKRKDKISKGLEFFNVPSPDTNYYNSFEKFLSNLKSIKELITL